MSSRWHLAFAPTFQGLSTPFPGLSQKLQHDPALWSWPSRCLQFVLHSEQPAQARSSWSHLAFAPGRHQGLSTPFPGLSQKLQHDPALALLLAHVLLAVRGAQLAVALVCSLLHRDSGGGCHSGVHRERKDEAKHDHGRVGSCRGTGWHAL